MRSSTFDPIHIFSENAVQAFDRGAGRALIGGRNPHLGNLLLAERNIYYLQILYGMLLLRRAQNLEPLYEDLYDSVRQAQSLVEGKDYDLDHFRADLDQLTAWGLTNSRIEKERIRGYRDNRKRKFRYSLTEEASAFLNWLEERLHEDLEERGADARNQLEDAVHSLKDLLRYLRAFRPDQGGEEEARRVTYHLLKVEEITNAIHVNLSDFNARLLGFITRSYNHRELKDIIVELETYLQDFLRKMGSLNQEVMPLLETLNKDKYMTRIAAALEIMEEERKRAPHFLRRNRQNPGHRNIPRDLLAFHRQGGLLDQLCGRIHESAFMVVRKMYAYLRELERKSHRIEDIRDRLTELVQCNEDMVPRDFFQELISPVLMRADPHHWNDHEKADPPRPRKYYQREEDRPKNYLRDKREGLKPANSMEMQRMLELDDWLRGRVFRDRNRKISQGAFSGYEDFARLIRLAKSGYLNGGRRLARIGYRLDTESDEISLTLEERTLRFRDMRIEDLK
ncbi:MAG: DUF2397 family protein [Acidobacteriota bacterium]|nr:DUF2397 family protein [Acidobacteriota bacterium]